MGDPWQGPPVLLPFVLLAANYRGTPWALPGLGVQPAAQEEVWRNPQDLSAQAHPHYVWTGTPATWAEHIFVTSRRYLNVPETSSTQLVFSAVHVA